MLDLSDDWVYLEEKLMDVEVEGFFDGTMLSSILEDGLSQGMVVGVGRLQGLNLNYQCLVPFFNVLLVK